MSNIYTWVKLTHSISLSFNMVLDTSRHELVLLKDTPNCHAQVSVLVPTHDSQIDNPILLKQYSTWFKLLKNTTER